MARRSGWRHVKYHMRPDRVFFRFMTGGKHNSVKSLRRAAVGNKTLGTKATIRRQHKKWTKDAAKQRAADRKAATAARRERAQTEQKTTQNAAREQRLAQAAGARPIDPRTGRPITWAQAQRSVRDANARADRLAKGLPGDAPARRPRVAKPELTPLQRAIAQVQKASPPKTKRQPARAGTKPRSRGPKVQPFPPIPVGAAPRPLARPGRDLAGVVMAATCACHGTGRVPVFGPDGRTLAGTTSCSTHGRGGTGRGSKKWSMRGAIRESGLPGLAARLERKHTSKRGNSDKRQYKAWFEATRQARHAGPTWECEWCDGGIVNRRLTEDLRTKHIAELLAAATAAGEAPPSKRKLEQSARRAYPFDLCSKCQGLGRVRSTVDNPQAGQFPVAQWRAGANLPEGHRLTAREKATGKRGTENARRVERRRKLPRL